ncbi:hypothetical protein MMC18_009403 [Xylographa bjoerkii]|nr:hypothetical protein [Xylographa bjoerkii]
MSDPAPATTPTYKTDPVPADWNNKSNDQKIEWLNTQGLPSDPTVNLGQCYRQGAKLTSIFRIVFNVLKYLRGAVLAKDNAALKKKFAAFAMAMNNGVARLSNYIYDNSMTLLKNGKYIDGTTPLTPVSIPDLPTIDGDEAAKPPSTEKPFKDTFWGAFIDTLSVLIDSWPWLKSVQPSMNGSYAELLKTVADAGQTFFQEYQKTQGDN